MDRPARTIDLAALIDGKKLTPFNWVLMTLSWLITMFDGLDMMMISFTAPYMRDELSLTTTQLGNVFSAGTAGMVVGGLGFTYIGDRIGRRPTIIVAGLSFGLLTFLTGFARSYEALLVLRFLDGLAIGGLLPLAWALNIEFVPKRVRATVIAFIMMGFSIGSAVAGPLTNWLAPIYGWEGVYFAGGGATILCAIVVAFWLPESPRFLINKDIKPELVTATLKRYDATLDIRPDDRFVLGDETQNKANFRLGDLFIGRLKWITPLVWLGYGASALGIFFKASWGPIVLEEMAVPRETAATVSSIGGLFGAIAGVAIMRLAERYGLLVVALVPAVLVPLALLIGFDVFTGTPLFLPLIVVLAMLVGGGHAAIISQLALYYPTAIRASAGGWASAVGKVGGVIGPIIGAAVLSSGIPAARTYAVAAICPFILMLCVLWIYFLVERADRKAASGTKVAVAH
ncbi:MAG TPA: MFS transporter [Sphingobium sp.]|nr:MFS transporter [Sphingobium sp.]